MEDIEEAQNVGELLRNARLKKGKTLSDVSKDLCIRKYYLEAIENLDGKSLPPLPYGLGFVRSYSEYLGLDATNVVQNYRQAAYADSEDDAAQNSAEDISSSDINGPNPKHIIAGLVGLIAIFIVWSAVSTYNKPKIEEEKDAMTDSIVPEPVIIEESEPTLPEMGVSDIEPVAEPTAAPSEETKAEPVEAPAAKPVAQIEKPVEEPIIENKKQTETAVKEIKDTKKVKEVKKVADQEPASVTPTRIRMVLAGPSWVELRQGNKVLLSGIYSKGFKYDIPNEAGMIVSVGRYYNVDFYVDGKLTKIASAMKQMNINLDKYILPQQSEE